MLDGPEGTPRTASATVRETTSASTSLRGPRHVAFLASSSCSIGSHNVEGTTVRQRQKERAQRAALRVELLRPLPEPQEHVLNDLLGEGVTADKTTSEPENGLTMALHDLRHRDLVTMADRRDERTVVDDVEMSPRHVPHRVGSSQQTVGTSPRAGGECRVVGEAAAEVAAGAVTICCCVEHGLHSAFHLK